jgi:CheY-like chemotaxis protein
MDAVVMLSMVLGAYGHKTAVAHGGREAIKVAESSAPDIVFLDLGMPQMSVYEVAAAL